MDEPWDVIVVGQGLAGSALAWQLQAAGQRVLVIDALEPVTSSGIAAGLITPVAGQRLVKDPRFETFMPTARAFYSSVEQRTGRRVFHDRTAVRLFRSENERTKWNERRQNPEYQSLAVTPQPVPLTDPDLLDTRYGGVALHAAQLDVKAFLDICRSDLSWEQRTIDWRTDVDIGPDSVRVGDHSCRFMIACEGHRGSANPYFGAVRFKSVKGDILTVRFGKPLPGINLHREIWLAPTSEPNSFRVGATYDRNYTSLEPDPAARRWIEERLNALIKVPYEVVDHSAAVRPVLSSDRVLIGFHPDHKRLGFFNGLGSKGALQAPWYAEKLTQALVQDVALPTDIDIAEQINW